MIYKKAQIQHVAKELISNVLSKTLAFHAPMGAGKTTLIKAMLKKLGAADAGNSPTFGIVNEYHDHQDELLAYHFDFYRLEDEAEAMDLGFEDYLDQGIWIFIEWPEKIKSLIPENAADVFIEILDPETRTIRF